MSRNTRRIPFFRPSIGRSEIAAVRRVMKSGWLTTGPESTAFETEFAAFLDRGGPRPDRSLQAVALNSATAGLHLALEALGIGPGDRVAVPSLTFTATAEVVCYLGADPVFVDSSPRDGNIDPEALSRVAGTIRAVIPVHLAGHPCDMAGIRQALTGRDVFVVEDAAHAFPSRTGDGSVGTLSDIGVFSFYATKTITTGEGGMAVTRNPDFARRMRLMRLHGIDREVWNRYSSDAALGSWEYDIAAPGYKYNMTDMAAALGRAQLARAEVLLNRRRRLADRYAAELEGIPGVELPARADAHAWHLFMIRLPDRDARDRLAAALHRRGIGVSVHFTPLHRMSYWRERYHLRPSDFPVAESLGDRLLSLPLWPGLPRRRQMHVVNAIRTAMNG